jgi:hypothetical protein
MTDSTGPVTGARKAGLRVDATPGLTCTEISRVQRTVVGEPAYCVLAELQLDSKQA